MKKRLVRLVTIFMAAAFWMVCGGCGEKEQEPPVSEEGMTEPGQETESGNAERAETEDTKGSESGDMEETGPMESVAEILYSNINFDFGEQIAVEKNGLKLVPDVGEFLLSVMDAKGAAGVQLVPAIDESNDADYYLNAFVAGNELIISAQEEAEIVSAKSSISGELEVKPDGIVAVIPAVIKAADPTDEVITVAMEDGKEYNLHTLHESMPGMEITGEGVAPENAGIYDFSLDKFFIRVNTEGELVYYRNMDCVGELLAENFARQVTSDSSYFTYFVELHPEYRHSTGGYSSGMYVVMDENYNEIDYVTLLPNEDPDHTHDQGYLDQHEFVVVGDHHYLTLSYTPELISNLPDGIPGVDGGNTAYVWAGVFQEVKDGKVLKEISTTDYPLLYDSAVERIDYENSTDQGMEVQVNNESRLVQAEGWMDYIHVNSLDYTLNTAGEVEKLLVSMRDQSALYQFDFATGAIEWILGGKASTLTGYEAYTSDRTDDNGTGFKALTFGQHFARYTNRQADGSINGKPQISVFDNQTGSAPFLMAAEIPTMTRTFKATIDPKAKTAVISDVVNGGDLDKRTGKYHNASHCGSVIYANENSVIVGWGLHAVVDNIGAMAPEGTIADVGFEDLRISSRPIFTEYDAAGDKVTFELTGIRNPNYKGHEPFFSYRTYKTSK